MKQTYPFDNIIHCLREVMEVPGPFIELGVFMGHTLIPLALIAEIQLKRCHAVDSFMGMSKPTRRDGKIGKKAYPEGKFSIGGPLLIHERLDAAELTNVTIHAGFVPEVLDEIDVTGFSFAHVDLDQHDPTLQALEWVWPRMQPDGIIAVHDWMPKVNIMATGALKKFVAEKKLEIAGENRKTAWIRKEGE